MKQFPRLASETWRGLWGTMVEVIQQGIRTSLISCASSPNLFSLKFRAKALISPIFTFYFYSSIGSSYSYNNNIHFQLLRARFASHSFSLTHSLSTFIFHLTIFMHRFNPHIHEIYTQQAKRKIFTEFSFFLFIFAFNRAQNKGGNISA